MSEAENIDAIRRFCAAWSNFDIPAIMEFFADDAVYTSASVGAGALGGLANGVSTSVSIVSR